MADLPTLTRRQFAELLQVAPASVTNWMQAGMPHDSGGRQGREVSIDLRDALPWVLQQRGAAPAGSQRDRLAKEQADKVALANAVERGDHMLRSQVEPVLLTLTAELSALLDAIPGRLANELANLSDPAEIRHRLLAEHRGVRAGLAEHLRQLAGRQPDAGARRGGDDAAAAPVPARVGGRKPRAAAGKSRARKVAK